MFFLDFPLYICNIYKYLLKCVTDVYLYYVEFTPLRIYERVRNKTLVLILIVCFFFLFFFIHSLFWSK